MLKIWGRRNSLNVQKIMWLIGELRLEHVHIDAGGSFGGLDAPEFLAMNPNGRVPVIDDDGAIVWESHTIIRYLSARYAMGTLWAAGPSERSLADRWLDWTLATLQPAFMDLFWGFYRTPENLRDWPRIEKAQARCSESFSMLDRHLRRRAYLVADELSMADFSAGTSLYRYFQLDISRPELPGVAAWYGRLTERAPYREHVMVAFDELSGRLDY